MARKVLTDAESRIMDVLWASSPRSMMEITRTLEGETGWSKHTVTTLLKRMIEKETVSVDTTGPVRLYSALLPKEDMARAETRSLLKRMFSGNAALLVNSLVEEGELSREDLESLLGLMEQKKK